MSDEIINKVAQSGIIQLDLSEMVMQGNRMTIDLKENLFEGVLLREKDFREFIKTNDWNKYKDALVNVTCTADAVIPSWAYMLITSALAGIAKKIVFGDRDKLETVIWNDVFDKLNTSAYTDARVVVKGCSDIPVPEAAYVALSEKLIPVVKSLMFGEPCSTVPVYKKK
ncbi:MAG: DUF2480 family protein [Flavobacteriales bacterium]